MVRVPAEVALAGLGGALAVGLWAGIVALGPAGWERIGHGGVFGDFVTIYLPQAARLNEGHGEIVAGWLYPPPLAVALRPLAALGEGQAVLVWQGVLAVSALALVALSRRALGGAGRSAWPLAVVLVALSAPLVDNVKWGQVNLPLAVLGLVALTLGGRTGGVLLGVAGAVKLSPLAWALPWALRRQRTELRWTGASLVLVLLAATLTVTLDVAIQMYAASWFEVGGKDYAAWGGQDLPDLLRRGFVRGTVLDYRHAGPLWIPLPRAITPGVANLIFRLVALGFFGFTALRIRAGGDPRLIFPAWALAMPPGWTHTFVFLPVVFGAGIARGGRARWAAVLGVLLGTAPLIGLVWAPTGWNAATAWGATSGAALLGWLALVLPASQTAPSRG